MREPGDTTACAAPVGEPAFSVVVELENAQTVSCEATDKTLRILAEQIAELSALGSMQRPEVIFVHGGPAGDDESILANVAQRTPELARVASLACVSLPGGRYYELKNAGIARARGQAIVLLDSDLTPEPGWLSALLAPVARGAAVVNGFTHLGYDGFVSRTLALAWIFPLRAHDAHRASHRSLVANNCAFRGEWIKAHPFPIDNGFKVGCTKLVHQMQRLGIAMERVDAHGAHASLAGWRFMLWRALVTGRDADRKYADLKSAARGRRLAHALGCWVKTVRRAVWRVVTLHRYVALPWWQMPAAAFLAATFYTLAFAGQLARAAGITRERPEYIPAYAEAH